MKSLHNAAKIVINDCMGIRPGEKVVVVADTPLKKLGEIFFEAAKSAQAEALLLVMLPRTSNGEEPPAAVAAALLETDAALLVTSKSLSHTRARKAANNKGTRIASLPGLTEEVMARTLSSGYEAIASRCILFAEKLSQGKEVHITTSLGTDLTFSIAGREGAADTGLLRVPGIFGNLPAGEAYVAPVEGTAQGKLVIDGSMSAIGLISEPILIKVGNNWRKRSGKTKPAYGKAWTKGPEYCRIGYWPKSGCNNHRSGY